LTFQKRNLALGKLHHTMTREKITLDACPLQCYISSTLLLLQHTVEMPRKPEQRDLLSRRERQIMDILYQRGRASASEIHEALPDRPSYSAVRAKLRVLEDKGHVRHAEESLRYVYAPTVPRDKAKRSAVQHLLATFFENSAEQAVAALLDVSAAGLSRPDLDRLSALIEEAKRKGDWK
jgi:BlaI family penicillinase repressor